MLNNKTILKLSKKKLMFYIFTLSLLEPQYFSTIAVLDYFFLFIKLLIGIYYFSLIIRNFRNYLNSSLIAIMLLCMYMAVNMFIHGHMSLSKIMDFYETFVFCMIISVEIYNKKKVEFLEVLANTTLFYLIVNFITLFVFPDGLYTTITASVWKKVHFCWLLGYKNPMSRFVVSAVGINLCHTMINKKNQVKCLICVAIGIITVIKVDSATSLVALVILIGLFLYSKEFKWPKMLGVRNITILGGFLSYLIIVFRIQEKLEYLVTVILKRSLTLTGREVIWQRSIEQIKNSLVFGNGLQNGLVTFEKIGATHPHNFFLYILYTGGVVSITLFFVFICSINRRTVNNLNHKGVGVCIITYAAMIVLGITESLTQMMSLLFVICMIAASLNGIGDNRYGKENVQK